MVANYIPKILILCCHNAVHSAEELREKLKHPENINLVEFPCTSKIETHYALRAFEQGIDGICIIACEEGECHYLEGNLRAKRRAHQIKVLLEELKLGGERIAFYNMNSSSDTKFIKLVNEFIERVKAQGLSPLKS